MTFTRATQHLGLSNIVSGICETSYLRRRLFSVVVEHGDVLVFTLSFVFDSAKYSDSSIVHKMTEWSGILRDGGFNLNYCIRSDISFTRKSVTFSKHVYGTAI